MNVDKYIISRFFLISLLYCLVFASRSFSTEIFIQRHEVHVIRPETTKGLQAFFKTLEYDWAELEEGVPPLVLEKIPTDISKTTSTKQKKRTFFMGLLPMILLANQEIAREREDFLKILERHRNKQLTDDDEERINELLKRYGLRGHPLTDHRTRSQLLRRIDTIPPALVLAQAANESAWGSSRFAQLGNNLFGEWTFKPGTGIVPSSRPAGATYEVRKFTSIYESIRSYMNNLNRHGAYEILRRIRENLRNKGQQVTGTDLAKGLEKYSQRGVDYIKEIQAMIRQNKLSRTNEVSLRLVPANALISLSASGSGLVSSRNRMIGHLSPTR